MNAKDVIRAIQGQEGYSDRQMAELIDRSLRSFYRYKSGTAEPPQEVLDVLRRFYETRVAHRSKPLVTRAIAFVDGEWLLYALKDLLIPEELRPDSRHINYFEHPVWNRLEGKYRQVFNNLPRVLEREVGKYLFRSEIELVRIYAFGALEREELGRNLREKANQVTDFFLSLRGLPGYETPVAFSEHHVPMLMATYMLGYQSVDWASLDLVIVVAGDNAFIPVMEMVKRYGIRVAVASIKRACSSHFLDERFSDKIKDFPFIWLDTIISDLVSLGRPKELESRSETKIEGTITHIFFEKRWGFIVDGRGREFFFASRNLQEGIDFDSLGVGQSCWFYIDESAADAGRKAARKVYPYIVASELRAGTIRKLNRGQDIESRYGLVCDDDGHEFYFHEVHLPPDVDFDSLKEGQRCRFEILREPSAKGPGVVQELHIPVGRVA